MNIKGFLLRFFALWGVLLTLSLGGGALAVYLWIAQAREEPKLPEKMVLELDLTRPIVERPQEFRISLPSLFDKQNEGTPLLYAVRALEIAKDDPRVSGLVARIGSETPELVHAQELAVALRHFRAKGKFTYVYAPNYGDFSNGGTIYYLASQFENIWLQPIGTVGLSGLSIEAPFGKTALDKLGVQPDFLRREEYKSVMENFTRDSFSPPVRANMESMLQSLNAQLADGIAQGRSFAPSLAKDLIKNGPYTANEAAKNRLVTKIGYEDDMHKEIDEKSGKDAEWVAPADYLYIANKQQNFQTKGTAAIIYAEGMIVDDPGHGPSRLAEDGVIDTQELVGAINDATDDKDVQLILIRVNSPGGSPSASETIRHAIVKAKEAKKPVFVSMGQVAASGGYWISMDADRIIADPATITGSIGVVAGKFALGGLFEKIGLKWDSVGDTQEAKMWSPRAPFDERGRERLNAMLDETYQAFTDGVSSARKIPADKIGNVAKGRVFTGEQALEAGLVDEIGGIDTALRAVKKRLDLQPDDKIALIQFPEPETPRSLVIRMLRNLRFGGAMVRDTFDLMQRISQVAGPLLLELKASTSPLSAQLPSYWRAAQ